MAAALAQVKYVFVEHDADWKQKQWGDMTAADQEEAGEAWREAELRPIFDSAEGRDEDVVMQEEENMKIQEAMMSYIRKDLKWTHRELHDALLEAEVAVPVVPSIHNYI